MSITNTRSAMNVGGMAEAVADEIEVLRDIHDRILNMQGSADSYFSSVRNPQAMRVLNSFDKFAGTVGYAKRSGMMLLQILGEARDAAGR